MPTYRDYTDAEIVQRGEAIYSERIQPVTNLEDKGKFVVIDVESGEWAMGENQPALSRALHAKRPEAPLYIMRVGFPYAARLGSGWAPK
jgi:hypothetical protein